MRSKGGVLGLVSGPGLGDGGSIRIYSHPFQMPGTSSGIARMLTGTIPLSDFVLCLEKAKKGVNLKVWASKLAKHREERKEELGAKSNIKKALWEIMIRTKMMMSILA